MFIYYNCLFITTAILLMDRIITYFVIINNNLLNNLIDNLNKFSIKNIFDNYNTYSNAFLEYLNNKKNKKEIENKTLHSMYINTYLLKKYNQMNKKNN